MKLIRFLLAICLMALPAFAQTTRRGRVTDESGAGVPGADVTITGPGSLSRATVSAADGSYPFGDLPAGRYTVHASAPGLVLRHPAKITTQCSYQPLNLLVSVAMEKQEVTVAENGGPTVSTEASNNASAVVISGSDLNALSDNPDDLAADLQALAGPAAGPNGGSIFIDGFSGGEIPPKESIREVRINQDPFSAEYDKLGYGRIEIFTKPGSNKYHATADYNFANDFWNSRNPYSAQKAPLTLNELEGGGSGPLGKRASFSVDAQHNRVDNGAIVNAITLDAQSLTQQPYSAIFTVPQRYTRVTPRIDYQLSANNTLSLRYGVTRGDID